MHIKRHWVGVPTVRNAPAEQLNLEQAVLIYRDEWIVEYGFHRLKSVPLSLNPLFVKNDDQVVGLTNLLSVAYEC